MKSEFALAFNQICAEYSLPREVVLDAVRAALITAYRRAGRSTLPNITADINLETGLARIYAEKVVVEVVEDEDVQISLEEGRKIKPGVQVGDRIRLDVTPRNFGRIAAQTAKQVITQRLREAERENQYHRFSRQEGEIIIGTVQSIKPHGIILHLERREEAIMPKREQIPGERYTLHQKIRVYVLDVKRTPRGPEIIVSRSHPRMLRRLLELEVPEIRNGQVEIKGIAREAGSRSKVAVYARQPGVDPVGACVGMRGIRIQTISRELHGERIDVIEWNKDPATYIANALSLRDVLSVVLDEFNPGGRTAYVVVMDDQLSLGIGRAGQNARLAAKLTGWRVDIEGTTAAALWALEQVNTTPELLDRLKQHAMLIPKLASIMRLHEKERYPYNDEEKRVLKTVIEAVRQALIEQRNAEHPGVRQARARRTAQMRAEAARREAEARAKASVPRETYTLPLERLDVPGKVLQHLRRNHLRSVGEVMERVAMGDEAVLMLDGIGSRALRQIKAAVEKIRRLYPEPKPAETQEPEEKIASKDAAKAEAPEAEQPTPTEAVPGIGEEKAVTVAASPEAKAQRGEKEVGRAESAKLSSTERPPEEERRISEVEAIPSIEAVAPTPSTTPMPKTEEEKREADFELSFEFPQTPQFGAFEFVEDEELEEESLRKKRKKSKRRKKGRTLVYDDETGEMVVIRKRRRRRSDVWEEFEDF